MKQKKLQRYVNIGNEIMEYLESNYKDNFKNIAVSLALLTLFQSPCTCH